MCVSTDETPGFPRSPAGTVAWESEGLLERDDVARPVLPGELLCFRDLRLRHAADTMPITPRKSRRSSMPRARCVDPEPSHELETAGEGVEAFLEADEVDALPSLSFGSICSVATSVHGGDAPVNQLTIIVTREMAFALRAKTLDADNLMLALLDRWMTDRGVRVARVEAFYGRTHLATAKTRVFGAPRVEYH